MIENYENLGFYALQKGDYQEAINIFKRALEYNQISKLYLGLAIAYKNLGNIARAKWILRKALAIEPENRDVLNYLNKIESFQNVNLPNANHQSNFRVSKNFIELRERDKWNKFFVKGINIGLGLPGYFPGEYSIEKATYKKWFRLISELGVNTVRVYTMMPPGFYEALYDFNNIGKKLYLVQGIWYELPNDYNFSRADFLEYIYADIKNTVNAVYGNTVLPEKPGYAFGTYKYDVSAYTVAFLLTREPENCAVKLYNEMYNRKVADYRGEFLEIKAGSPFEVWITGICDFIQKYEYNEYKITHPVSFVNWPTLDPLTHWSESKYEDELKFQGIDVKIKDCVENEDEESIDTVKIKSLKGAGFFASYHVYPAFPDFMVYDYLQEESPYRSYLYELKKHHVNQPILIAEFGMASSRDIAHWHNKGWHHGGHNELDQGKISEILLNDIFETGMSGAILFSWFDEWYKKTWIFAPYYIPSDNKKSWFNIQDPENNYGLVATYPNYPEKKVTLSGNKKEWEMAEVLYEKKDKNLLFQFKDGFNDSRNLRKLSIQHDEGFIYIMLEIEGKIDFKYANYLIGIDTFNAEEGEFLLPFNTKVISPTGLKFLIHLCGFKKSRILTAKSYDKYLKSKTESIKPVKSNSGEWVLMFMKTNRRRISKDGHRIFPAHILSISNLRFGSLDRQSPYRESIADFFVKDNLLELRIPWSIAGFTDPASKLVLWQDGDELVRKTDGIRIIVVSYKPEKHSLLAVNTALPHNITDCLPEKFELGDVKTYSWKEWQTPVYHFYLKESYYIYKNALLNISDKMR